MIVNEIRPIGYCLGVVQAINISLKIRKEYKNRPIYVFGLLVHNEFVTELMKKNGIETIDTTNIDVKKRLEEFQKDDIVIFTAHGHPFIYEEILKKRGIMYFDTTCVNVRKNIKLILDNIPDRDIIYIGTKSHPETNTALSLGKNVFLYDMKNGIDYSLIKSIDPLVINQTTLSLLEIASIHQDILSHFPNAIIEEEICSATRIRQEEILKIKDDVDLIVVIGSNKSSNSRKLFEVSESTHRDKKVIMVDSLNKVKEYNLSSYKNAIVVSGTSTALETIREIEEYLKGE